MDATGSVVRIGRQQVEALRVGEHLFIQRGEFRGKPQPELSLYLPSYRDDAREYDLDTWERKAWLSMWKTELMELLGHRKEIEGFLRSM